MSGKCLEHQSTMPIYKEPDEQFQSTMPIYKGPNKQFTNEIVSTNIANNTSRTRLPDVSTLANIRVVIDDEFDVEYRDKDVYQINILI